MRTEVNSSPRKQYIFIIITDVIIDSFITKDIKMNIRLFQLRLLKSKADIKSIRRQNSKGLLGIANKFMDHEFNKPQ